MEIRIQSGENILGPYTEDQIRQYITAGLIAASDPALGEDMSEWTTVEQLLALSAGPDDARASVGNPDQGAESLRSVSIRTASQPKVRRGPIVLQAPIGVEGAPKRGRSGKTAITIEAPRPTTQLPPVAKFVPREEPKPSKSVFDTDQLAPGHFFERPAGGTASLPVTPDVPPADAPQEPEVELPTEPTVEPLAEAEPALEIAPDLAPGESLPAAALVIEPSTPPAPDPVAPAPTPAVVPVKRRLSLKKLFAGITGLPMVILLAFFTRYFVAPPTFPTSREMTTGLAAAAPAVSAPAQASASADLSDSGFAMQEKGDLDEALVEYGKAIALDPRNAEAVYRRAVARQTKGDWRGALADYNALLVLDPDNADAYSNRGYVKQTLGDFDGALADYNQALTRKPTIAAAFFNVGLIKVRRGDIDGGIAAYDKALELDPKLARAYYNRGNAKNTEGDLDGAIADYTQSIELEPTNAMACLNRGAARQAKGDLAGALADYSEAVAHDANLAPAYRARASIEVARGDLTAADTDAGKALDLASDDPSPLFTRGLAQLGLHNLENADAAFEKYCAAAPHTPESDTARLYLWVIAAGENSRDKADDDLNNAVLNSWNSSPEDLTSKIADFLVGHIREDELIADASTPDAKQEPGRFCRVWYFAGVKRMITGDTATALDYFQKSLATGQNNFCEYLFARAQILSLGQARQASTPTSARVP